MSEQTSFWRNKRVLITGHTGFKGGWLAIWLKSLGAQVGGASLKPKTFPNLFEVAGVGTGMTNSFVDIRHSELLTEAVKSFSPEIVFHMAAQPLVRQSYADPVETFSTNVMGTVNLFEACNACPSIRAIVNVTTDKCYRNSEWVWGYRESDPIGGRDPYSSSKACSELVTEAYRDSFFSGEGQASIASARAGNVIGGGDWSNDRLIPDIIRAYETGNTLSIRYPEATRPWQHVLEPLFGYIKLAEKLYAQNKNFTGAWNFGPNNDSAKPVSWIVNRMEQLFDGKLNWKIEGSAIHEANYLKLDISKAKEELLWEPKWGLEESLIAVIEWHDAFRTNADMHSFCINQINGYMGR